MAPSALKTKAHYRLFIVLGFACLIHSAYSTIQYHKHLRMVGEDYVGSPLDILFEIVLGFVLCAFGILNTASDFLPIKMAQTFEKKTVEDYLFRPEFVTFNHRGRVVGKMMLGAGGDGEGPTGG
eukprot:CAMPEP_0173398744 /NCGR_PEP_ID=MMETSP1356-20130122/42832_1 /TAXON_ID=77927 ORGANISM="Hemiselmis virescens, Strain PCC157" /NCGR_SAMPLE_ID=MMETSP1356 /ASSEMBLY_ACC=CAM_ASM_000847 /LENGTH=123 /DNA_ID=CAMNT_0014358323 /DNA_START=62 /DNA_END=429 /DNA_ORIENTATION=+